MPGKKSRGLGVFLPAAFIAAGLLAAGLLTRSWGLLAATILGAALFFCYLGFEYSPASAREIGLIAVLGAIAAVGRVPFAALPGIQPVTFMVVVSGFVFGPRAGFMVGSTAALVSNFFLGQGPWTPWQMLTWGLAGITAGLLRRVLPQPKSAVRVLFCSIWGYLYGAIMDIWFWTAFVHPLTWKSFLATWAAGFWFDTLHALGNAGFYLVLGPRLIRVLERFRKKMLFEFVETQPD
ncbi:MAG: ECF transporter S component [Thermacetogeniaceae bacterium]